MGTDYYVGNVTLKAEAVAAVEAEIERLKVQHRIQVEREEGGLPYLHQTRTDMAYSTTAAVDDLLDVIAKADLIEPAVQFVAWGCDHPQAGFHVLVAGQGVVSSADDSIRKIEVGAEVPAGEFIVPVRAYCDGRGKALVLGGMLWRATFTEMLLRLAKAMRQAP